MGFDDDLRKMGHFATADTVEMLYKLDRAGLDDICFECPNCSEEHWHKRGCLPERCDVCGQHFDEPDYDSRTKED